MVLHAGHMANRFAGKVTQSGPLRLLDNPIITALLITVLAMAIFFSILSEDGCLAETGWHARIRVAVYVFAATAAVLSLHYYAQKRTLSSHYKQDASDELMSHLDRSHERSVLGSRNPDHVPVFPGASDQPSTPDHPVAKTGAAESPDDLGELNIRPASINLLPQLPAPP
jgi:hypothetical protein